MKAFFVALLGLVSVGVGIVLVVQTILPWQRESATQAPNIHNEKEKLLARKIWL